MLPAMFPERVRIVFSDTRVIWIAKQSIIRVEREGGAYDRVSGMTPVKGLIVVCDRVFCASEQIGEVLRW